MERERISRELHDTLTQSLTGLVMLSQRAARLAGAEEPDLPALRRQLELVDDVAREALGEARAVVASSASLQVDRGLAAALSLLAERMTRETGILVSSAVTASTTRELEVVLLRCAQEALANVRKHSGATMARVEVTHDSADLRLSITDDGTGFDRVDRAATRGFGLTGMSERLALVGGDLDVSRTPTGGARLVITIPEGARA
jgi:signal transduction histidine kinase